MSSVYQKYFILLNRNLPLFEFFLMQKPTTCHYNWVLFYTKYGSILGGIRVLKVEKPHSIMWFSIA